MDHRDKNSTPRRVRLVGYLAAGLCVAVLALLAWRNLFSGSRGGNVARLYIGGDEVRSFQLGPDDGYRVDLLEEYGVPASLEVREGQIRFVDVTCPDHICEKTGWIGATGQSAVCMPNRAAVVVTE